MLKRGHLYFGQGPVKRLRIIYTEISGKLIGDINGMTLSILRREEHSPAGAHSEPPNNKKGPKKGSRETFPRRSVESMVEERLGEASLAIDRKGGYPYIQPL
jgi:hypothetical protein